MPLVKYAYNEKNFAVLKSTPVYKFIKTIILGRLRIIRPLVSKWFVAGLLL